MRWRFWARKKPKPLEIIGHVDEMFEDDTGVHVKMTLTPEQFRRLFDKK